MIAFVIQTMLQITTFGSPILANQKSISYEDPICEGNIQNLWLDVMVVVDKSQQMTNAQLWQVRNTITQVFGTVKQFGPVKYPKDPRSTCVGVVTFDETATTNAQLDASKSFSDLYNVVQTSLVQVDSTNTTFLKSGLLAAEEAFNEGRTRTYRYNYKKVILVFAADYQGEGTSLDPKKIAKDLKKDNIIIISVSCASDPKTAEKIKKIASPGYSFVDEMNTAKLVGQVTNALINANCYCPEDYEQYRIDYHNSSSTQYAICVQGFKATGGSYGYQHAVEYCQSQEKNTFLANEFTYMLATFPAYNPSEYYIGLSYQKNQWVWEQPYGLDHIPLSGYTNWGPGFPQANSTGQVIAVQTFDNGTTYQWGPPQSNDWLFVCQIQASSTENYTDWAESL
uniref:VWFA domain-containing protein n=2 Tax=Caenorhabditis japonica TaxID=281687 RepID=A0A8R1I4P1_CAEJA